MKKNIEIDEIQENLGVKIIQVGWKQISAWKNMGL